MKKSLFTLLVVLLPLVSFAVIDTLENTKQYNTDAFQNCVLLESNDDHDIYQCPTDVQWIVDLQQKEPNGMFKYNFDSDETVFDKIAFDNEHFYVEIAFNDPNMCEQDYTIRTKIKQPGDELWALVGCE